MIDDVLQNASTLASGKHESSSGICFEPQVGITVMYSISRLNDRWSPTILGVITVTKIIIIIDYIQVNKQRGVSHAHIEINTFLKV